LKSGVLLMSALLWPVSTFLVKVSLVFKSHVWIYKYLVNSPIIFLLDLIVPAIYLFIWWALRKNLKVKVEQAPSQQNSQ
jgi:hypothetical protein